MIEEKGFDKNGVNVGNAGRGSFLAAKQDVFVE